MMGGSHICLKGGKLWEGGVDCGSVAHRCLKEGIFWEEYILGGSHIDV